MGESNSDFNILVFEKKLSQLKDTQESIQSLSSWCLKQRSHHKKIVSSWLNVLKRVKVEQRLTLFYLANDVIQYSKRKNYDFVASWGCYLQKATPLVRDEKVRKKILRIFKIWEQRSVYDEEFLSDLTGLLSAGAIKKTTDDALDFQPQQLVNKIRQCSSLESDTDQCLKVIHDSHLELSDADALCASLKDKRNMDEVEKELNEGAQCVEKYTQALQKEIVAREALIMLLKSASQYYSTQRGEVKVVALAYKTFGQRVKQLKKKLDELVPTLNSAAPSPPPRDEDVPSPGPDEDLDLPMEPDLDEDVSYNIDKTFNTSLTADGSLYNIGLSSFLGTDMLNVFNEPLGSQSTTDNGNKIEVINNRPEDTPPPLNVNNLIKTLIDSDEVDEESVSATNTSNTSGVQSQETLPGLDLLTPDSTGSLSRPAPFYGAVDNHVNDEPEQYTPELTNQWNNTTQMSSWSAPPVMTNVAPSFPRMDTPETPPVMTNMAQSFPRFTTPDTHPVMSNMAPAFSQINTPETHPPMTNVLPSFPAINTPESHTMSRVIIDTPESPPPVLGAIRPPLTVPHSTIYTPDLPSRDVDHRSTLPPPPPPPPLLPPTLSHLEDVDHRLLQTLPPPVIKPSLPRMSTPVKDVDHRNLISLTHQPAPQPVPMARGPDQDYRVPPPLGPNDIVESVDMDLSEDEDLQRFQRPFYSSNLGVGRNNFQDHYQNQSNLSQNFNKPNFNTTEHNRRVTSFQNNKVLVGGDLHRTDPQKQTLPVPKPNSVEDTIEPLKPPPMIPVALTAPPLQPLSNLFDNPAQKFDTPNRTFQSDSNLPFKSTSPNFDSNRSFNTSPNFDSNRQFTSTSQNFPTNQSFTSTNFEPNRQFSNPSDFQRSQPQKFDRLNNPEFSPSRNQFSNFAPKNDQSFESIEDAVRMLDSPNTVNDESEEFVSDRELVRNPSPPMSQDDWSEREYPNQQPMMPRFQRPWNPMMRNNFRPMPYGNPQQFWPRPRMPYRPWNRPRFW